MDMPRMTPPAEGGPSSPAKKGPRLSLIFLLFGVGMCLALIFGATSMVMPGLRRAGEVRSARQCRDNLRNLRTGLMIYANRNDGYLPPELTLATLPPRQRGRYRMNCPRTGGAYVLNPNLKGIRITDILDSANVVVVSEFGAPKTLPHGGKVNVICFSGNAREISRADEVVWDPKLKGDLDQAESVPY